MSDRIMTDSIMKTILLSAALVSGVLYVSRVESAAVVVPPGTYTEADWKALHSWRNEANFSHSYIPKHTSRWTCMMATEKDCRREDQMLGEHRGMISRNRREVRRRQLSRDSDAAINDEPERQLNPSIGNVKILVLLVRFKGDETKQVPDRQYFDDLLNGRGTSATNPVGSVREYLRYASLGKYTAQFVVQDWFQMSKTEAELSGGQGGRLGPDGLIPLFSDALAAVDAQFTDAQWREFDTSSRSSNTQVPDQLLDHLVVIHSSWGAEWGDSLNSCGANTQMNRIWSQGYNGVNQQLTVNNGQLSVGGYVVGAGKNRVCLDEPNPMGILTHEFMHGFGLLDLYDQDWQNTPIEIGGAGNYDLMSNTYGWNIDPSHPGSLGPVSKMDASWLSPIEITKNGVYAIQQSETSGQVYIIRGGQFPTGEYLLIENRQQVKWDSDWPASGIVVWHVDLLAGVQTSRGYPGSANWPTAHYMVAVLQADGLYEIEKGISRGNAGDFWLEGMTLPSSTTVWPNTASYQGGNVASTGITIEFMSPSQMVMNFRVSGLSGMAPRAPILTPLDAYGDRDVTLATDGLTGQVNHGLNISVHNRPTSGDLENLEAEKEHTDDKDTTFGTGSTATWVLSMLGGVATMLGLLAVAL